MSDISFVKKATPANADAGEKKLYFTVGGSLASIDESGVIQTYSTGVTPEEVQDIVGSFITTSGSIQVTYNDVANLMQLDLIQSAVDHTQISNRGTNTHAQIDSHITNTSNPHSVTKSQVGLGNCDNTSDLNKPISTATQTALNAKENTITAGTITQYWRGDKSWQTLDKASVGLGSVDNTSDLNKPISNLTQTALNTKENIISAGTTSQYWRGDKTWQTLDKNAVGLSNVPNVDATARANHTGTQLASTISDFSSSVLSVLLTGISFATNSAIVATDSVLVAFGKIQAQLNDHFGSGGSSHAEATSSVAGFMSALDKSKLDGIISDVISFVTTALTNTSNVTFTTITELQIPVVAGKRYKFESYLLFDSNATNTGIGISLGGTATGQLRAIAEAPVSNTAGTANKFSGPINAINGVMTTTGVGAVGTQYRCQIEGVFTATTNGFIYPQFRSETNGTQVRVNVDSCMTYKEY